MNFLPEQNESANSRIAVYPFETKLSTLNNRLSPILPLHFDKFYLPKNLCELQYLKLAECRLFNTIDNSNKCSYEVTKFQRCRTNRDIQILDGIKKWQTKHINSLQRENKRMYLQGLTFKLDRLKEEYSMVPSTNSKQIKLSEIQNQLETIKWRINYIKKLI